MVEFEESGMRFSFPEDSTYRIEKSKLLSEVQLKATECIVSRLGKLFFIEAKSSTPRPQSAELFDKFINEITDKFTHSLVFYNAIKLRHNEEELPTKLKKIDLSQATYAFVLIIHGHKLEWLPPLQDALKSKMRHTLRLWNIPDVAIKVINDSIAYNENLIGENK